MYYKFSEIATKLITIIVMLLSWLAPVAAQTLPEIQEPPIILQTSNVIPEVSLKGTNYQIEQNVENDGFINSYKLTTDYGPLTVESTSLLMIRLNELKALHHMQELTQTKAFKDAVKEGVKGPFKTIKGVATSPVDTVKNTGSGIGRWFSNVGRSVVSDDPHQEGTLSAALGYSTVKRRFAYEYGIDPYTSYEPVQRKLNEIARYSVAGGLTTKVAFRFVPGPAGMAVRMTGTSNSMRQLVRDKMPAELKKINKEKLKEMGVSESLADDFLQNPYYTPQEMTLLVGELESMRGVDGRDKFIKFASKADEESVARFMRMRAEMMAMYSANAKVGVRIIEVNGVSFLQKHDGLIVGLFPLDHVVWTAALWHKERAVVESIGRLPGGVTGKELWIEGTVDPVARKALEDREWKVEDKVRDKLFKKKP
jgi:hypothetical protein